MNYPKKTPDMCGRFDVSSKKSSGLACLNLHKREVIENIFIKSVKDFSEKRNFISFKPKDPNILNIVSGIGFLFVVLGTYRLEIWPLLFGGALQFCGKLWFVDRMVWLYEDMKHLPEYGKFEH